MEEYKYSNFANNHRGDQYSILIHSVTDSVATVYTYPNSAATSSEVQSLLAEAKMFQDAKVKEIADLRAKQDAEVKAAAELKAKQDAEVKAAAELKAKQVAEANAAAMKKTTITCVKGKLTKKVTAVKPKCPSGYKLKK